MSSTVTRSALDNGAPKQSEVKQVPVRLSLKPVVAGLSYTGGFWFLANDEKRGWYHPAWHVSTIAGTAFHYVFLLEFVARSSGFASMDSTRPRSQARVRGRWSPRISR